MLDLGCSNDHNMLRNVAFTVIPRWVWIWYLPKTLCKTALLSRSPSLQLWRSVNTDGGKRENETLLLLFSAILKILPVTQTRTKSNDGRECKQEHCKTRDLTLESLMCKLMCKLIPPSIFLALNFCSLTDCQKLWHNFSLFVNTSFDTN